MKEYPIERIWRDTRVSTIMAGTSEIMGEIIAREMGLYSVSKCRTTVARRKESRGGGG